MLNKQSIILALIASGLLSALVGFGLQKNDQTDSTAPAPFRETEPFNSKAPRDIDTDSKLSTELTEAEKKQAYHESLMVALPASLKGVPTPAQLDVDATGNLIINDKIRKMFDHYLSAIGEENTSASIDRIELLLSRQLSEPALGQALQILGGYIDYKAAIDSILQQSSLYQSGQFDAQAIASVKAQIRLERNTYFSEDVIEIFFGREDQYDDYSIARSKISQDNALSEQEKFSALSSLDQSSPAWLSEQNLHARRIDNFQFKERALKEAGAEKWEIQDLRRRELGEVAASNLEALDLRRSDWNARLVTYRQAVSEALTQYDDVNSEVAVARRDEIRAQHFKDNELRRVISLDAIERKE